MTRRADLPQDTFDLRHPWVLSLLSLSFIPLVPEYIAPFLAVFALLFAKADAARQNRRLRVGAAGRVMILFLCFMAVHLIWASNRLLSAFSLLYWLMMLCAYLALTSILSSRKRIEDTLFVFAVIIGLLGATACVQYVCVGVLGIDAVPLQLWDFLDSSIIELVPMNIYLHSLGTRAAATFSNPNLFAQVMLMATPLVAAYAFTGRRCAKKVIARLSALFGVLGIFFSFSRAAYLALCAVAIVMCIANIRRLVPILMVVSSVVLLIPASVYDRLASIGNASDVAIVERLDVWGVTMQTFFERPLFGHGLGIGTLWERLSAQGFIAPHAHNVFLEFLVEGGLFGLILLLFLLWKLFRTGFELIIHNPRTRMYGAAVIAFCAGFCVYGMFDHMLFTPKSIGMFMMVLSFADACSFAEMHRTPDTMRQSLPLLDTLVSKMESWVQKTTAPKENTPAEEEAIDLLDEEEEDLPEDRLS